MKNHLKLLLIASSLITVATLSSCVPIAAGAAAGYVVSEANE